jgi:suppressor of G2 allele of SKP1
MFNLRGLFREFFIDPNETDLSTEEEEEKEEEEEISKSFPCINYFWYQTCSHVVIIIPENDIKEENVEVDLGTDEFTAAVTMADGSDYQLKLQLLYPIIPNESVLTVTRSYIEIKLKKLRCIRWITLETFRTKSGAGQSLSEAV